MTPDLAQVLERVQAELGEIIDVLDREGPRYAARYAEHALTSRSAQSSPRTPAGMAPIAATIVRELVLDELAFTRRQPSLTQRRIGAGR